MAVPRTLAALLLLMVVGACVADAARSTVSASDSESIRSHGDGHHDGHGGHRFHKHGPGGGRHKYKYEHNVPTAAGPPVVPVPIPSWKSITLGSHQPQETCSVSALQQQASDTAVEEWNLKQIWIIYDSLHQIHCVDLWYTVGGEQLPEGASRSVGFSLCQPFCPVWSTGFCTEFVEVTPNGTVVPGNTSSFTVEIVKVNADVEPLEADETTTSQDSVNNAGKVVSLSGRSRASDGALVCLNMTFSKSGWRSFGECGSESTGTAGAAEEGQLRLIEQTVDLADGKLLDFPTKLCWTDNGKGVMGRGGGGGGGGGTLSALDVAVVGDLGGPVNYHPSTVSE